MADLNEGGVFLDELKEYEQEAQYVEDVYSQRGNPINNILHSSRTTKLSQSSNDLADKILAIRIDDAVEEFKNLVIGFSITGK